MPKMIIVERCDGTCKRVHKADINYKEVYCVLLRKYVDPSTLHPDCPLDDAPEPVWGCHKVVANGGDVLYLSCDGEVGHCDDWPESRKKEDCPHWRVVGKDGE